jgi:ABC-type spermidine/putrescine transport system permease subunit II
MAILLTLLFAAFLYLAHYLAEATVAAFTRGQADMNLPVPVWLQLLLSLESTLFAFRFPLIGLLLVVLLVATAWSDSRQ